MKGINWFELNLTPGEGLVPESYRLYVWMRRQSEYTLGWIRDQVIPSRAKWQNAENLSVVTSAVLGRKFIKIGLTERGHLLRRRLFIQNCFGITQCVLKRREC